MAQGDTAVYSKTGTTGKVVRILELDGKTWAELDSTGLLYDINSLEPATDIVPEGEAKPERRKEAKKRERAKEGGGPEDMRDEGSMDSTASICGAG